MFAQQRLAQGDAVKFADIGADRQTVHRRRADDGQITHARQAQLQGARDRRGGQGQHVNVRAHLLQALFVRHAEMLFFVDDQQAQVLETDAFGQQRMGADHNINGALAMPSRVALRVFGADKRGQVAHFDRKTAKPFGKGLYSAGAPATWWGQ